MFSSNVLAFFALAFVSQTVVAGPSVVPARAGLHSKLARRALKRQRVDDAQTSLQLDPSQIGPNLALTGQEVPAAGQVPSLTSTNNYINFCLTQDTVLTDGQQITTGSCNQTPMGRIIASDRMPVSRFTFPVNGGAIQANTGFTIKMTVVNIDAGHFTNPTTTYYNAPQTVNNNGIGVGHSHCVIEKISAFDTEDLPDVRNFAFFKGLNAAANADGQLTADVTGGLPVGFYKLTSINTASNHQPFLVAIAQHGTMDDSIYFEVSNDGKPSAANIAANSANTTAVDTNASASVSATASSTATATSVASDSVSTSDVATATASDAAASTENASASDKAGKGKDVVTASETAAASSTGTASSAAATTSAASDKGASDKNDKKAAESDVSSTPAETSSTPAKGAKATSTADVSSSVASSTASASASSASEPAETQKADKKGKN